MLNNKVCVNQLEPENTCIKVYDPETKTLIAVFRTYHKAAQKLGLVSTCIQRACATRYRIHCPVLNKKLAMRLSTIKDGDLERIEICNKKTLLTYEKV